MEEDFYGYDEDTETPGRDNLFLWTVFILMLIGVAFACWLGSFYVFGHPEKPQAYAILKKLGKIEPPRRFEITQAPPGEFLSPQRLFERYSGLKELELQRANEELLRNFIKNYKETKKLVPYATGRYEIIDSYELKKEDLFGSGLVAVAQAVEYPQVLIEHAFPSAPANVSAARSKLQMGLELGLRRTNDLAAIIHVERTFDGRMKFTVVPLLYGNYALMHGSGTFGTEPPEELNIGAGLPIIKGQLLQDSLKAYAEYRRRQPLPAVVNPGEEAEEPRGPELVRLETVRPGTAVPQSGSLPEMPVATPIPVNPSATTKASPPASTRASPAAIAKASPAPPRSTPAQVAMNATPVPSRPATPREAEAPATAQVSPQGVQLKPFIISNPAPGMQNAGASWRTYAPGRQPAGRTLTPSEASTLADRGEVGERLYLRGSFVVTASGENRAVLRSQGATGDPTRPGTAAARIIVEYPASAAPPTEGATFARDETRGFEVRDVRRGADGQINIYVREVTLPQ